MHEGANGKQDLTAGEQTLLVRDKAARGKGGYTGAETRVASRFTAT